jgi:benzoyl-CoA reductase/2-hydroxyglutaryl-CoA dehydratase subunit BcrC/BadD/HgdB
MFQLDPIFATIAADPMAYARRWKADTGRPVIGTLCSYASEEIVPAAGGLPLRLLPTRGGDQGADAHLQAYTWCVAPCPTGSRGVWRPSTAPCSLTPAIPCSG